MPTDLEIAQSVTLRPIRDVAAELGLSEDQIDLYGRYKARLPLEVATRPVKGKLVLVGRVSAHSRVYREDAILFCDDPSLLGAPHGFRVHISGVYPAAGDGFVMAQAGDIMTMPGQPAKPSAVRIGVDGAGRAIGLF